MADSKELKGWHVATMFVAAFTIIIGVNLALAFNAVATFPGLETKNSYVASQSFDADRTAQDALGWTVTLRLEGDELHLRFRDKNGAVAPEILQADLGVQPMSDKIKCRSFATLTANLSLPLPSIPATGITSESESC